MVKKLPSSKTGIPVKFTACVLGLCLAFTFTSKQVEAQTQLVKDLNTKESPYYREYSEFTNFNGTFYFISQKKELWKSNGTAAGTIRVKMAEQISNLTPSGSYLYFVLTNGQDKELWKTNGTAAGTTRVKDIRSGAMGSNPMELFDFNGTLYFSADNGTSGYELWKTNGTAAGTAMVKDINPGSASSYPGGFAVLDGLLYFSADDDTHGIELWRTNGTAAGTILVRDMNPGAANSNIWRLTATNDKLYFASSTPSAGQELWISDGTAAGTHIVKNINPGAGHAEISQIVAMGNAVYFDANDGVNGTALWKSDGTAAGTVMVKDIDPNSTETVEFSNMTVLNDNFYFRAGGWPISLWRSNGTEAGTQIILSTDEFYSPPQFSYANGFVYFLAAYWDSEEYTGFETLYRMNPDGSGLTEVWTTEAHWDLDDEQGDSFRISLVAIGNTVYFSGIFKDGEGHEILKTVAPSGPVTRVKDTFTPTESSNPSNFVQAGQLTFFTSEGDYGYQQHLWRTDGTTEGTVKLATLFSISLMINISNTLYFAGENVGNTWQLWKSDGTLSGTKMVKQLDRLTNGVARFFANVNGILYFSNTRGELWKSNGTPEGTVLLKTFPEVLQLMAYNNRAIILVKNASGAEEVWKSGGTPATTVLFRKISTQARWPERYRHYTIVNDILYFVGDRAGGGEEVWRTDGTNAGTWLVKSFRANDGTYGYIDNMVNFRDTLYIGAQDENKNYAIFKSDGTPEGTVKVSNIDGPVNDFIPYGQKLIFSSRTFPYFETQWVYSTDGTADGTQKVLELPVQDYHTELTFTVADNVIYFVYNGTEFFRTDGRDCGTVFITPDNGMRYIWPVSSVGDKLLMGGYASSRYGTELYTWDTAFDPGYECDDPPMFALASTEGVLTSSGETLFSSTPNPFQTDLTLQINSNHNATANVMVYTGNGAEVEHMPAVQTNVPHKIGQRWPQGMYILKVAVDGKIESRKLIKK